MTDTECTTAWIPTYAVHVSIMAVRGCMLHMQGAVYAVHLGVADCADIIVAPSASDGTMMMTPIYCVNSAFVEAGEPSGAAPVPGGIQR